MTTDKVLTKEQILENSCIGKTNNWLKSTIINIEDAMDEFSKQECIRFAKWISSHSLNFQSAEKDSWIGLNMVTITTEELYNIFLEDTKVK